MIAGWKITTVRRALDELMHFIEVNEKPHGWEGKPGRVSMYVRRSDGKFESRGATGSTLQEAMAALSAELAAQMEAEQVRFAMRQLTDEQAEVLSLRFLEGYSIQEVASMMNKTEGAIKALQYRAVATLRQLLEYSQASP